MITQEDIQKKALALFSKYGLRSVNMDDLAHHLGTSKKVLYQHFGSKEELVFSLFEQISTDWNEALKRIHELHQNPIQRLLAILQLRFDYVARLNPAFLLRSGRQYDRIYTFMSDAREQINQLTSSLLHEAQLEGYIHEHIHLPTYIQSHELLFDFFVEHHNPVNAGSEAVFRHLIFPSLAGIVIPEKYDVWKGV